MFEFLKNLFTEKQCTCCTVEETITVVEETNTTVEEIIIEECVEVPKPKLVKKIKVNLEEEVTETKPKKKKKKKVSKKDVKK